MNDEYERGELITDWSTAKQDDLIIDLETDIVYRYICYHKKLDLLILSCSNGFYQGYDPSINEFYRAIPKKKKVVKYLYEFVFDGVRATTDNHLKDDDDFKSKNPLTKYFHRLDWTAKEFDE